MGRRRGWGEGEEGEEYDYGMEGEEKEGKEEEGRTCLNLIIFTFTIINRKRSQ